CALPILSSRRRCARTARQRGPSGVNVHRTEVDGPRRRIRPHQQAGAHVGPRVSGCIRTGRGALEVNKSLIALPTLAALVVATLAGCAEPPTPDEPGAGGSGGASSGSGGESGGFKACMVSDSGGFDDKSFNETSHDGLVKAKEELGIET